MKELLITEEEFIRNYCERSGETWEDLQKTHFVMHCDSSCSYEGCKGWSMEPIKRSFTDEEFTALTMSS